MKQAGAIVLLLLCCLDGIPAFTCNGITLMPCEFMLLNLPPWIRFKVENMFISMLIPHSLSPQAQRKYFNKVIEVDLNPMAREGLHVDKGPPVYVKVFGQTLDLKGKEKFLDQVSVQSYSGCSHCAVKFPQGNRGPRFGVARRYLPTGHPLRSQVSLPYEYPEAEHAGTLIIGLFIICRQT